jgi:protein-tyrosine phosphatase
MVCTGNICRSPMAEAVFRNLVQEAGLEDQIEVDSAGTSGYHVGQATHPGTLKILKQHGIAHSGYSRRFTASDLHRFDYIIAMDDEHLSDIQYLGSTDAKVARLLDFAPEQPVRGVPDPYYNEVFQVVYDLVLAGSRGLLAKIRKDHNL